MSHRVRDSSVSGRSTAAPSFSRAPSSRRRSAPNRPAGYITSAVYSPALGEWIGLALLARRLGEGARIVARDPLRGGDTPVRVVPHTHFDPGGERMKT